MLVVEMRYEFVEGLKGGVGALAVRTEVALLTGEVDGLQVLFDSDVLDVVSRTSRTLDHFPSPLPLMDKLVSLKAAQAGGGIVAVAALGANQTGSFHRQTFLIFHFGLNWHDKGLRSSCCGLGRIFVRLSADNGSSVFTLNIISNSYGFAKTT